MPSRDAVVRVALVGGPMYDPLYAAIPSFERETGLAVEVVAQLPHPELNAFVKSAFPSGADGRGASPSGETAGCRRRRPRRSWR